MGRGKEQQGHEFTNPRFYRAIQVGESLMMLKLRSHPKKHITLLSWMRICTKAPPSLGSAISRSYTLPERLQDSRSGFGDLSSTSMFTDWACLASPGTRRVNKRAEGFIWIAYLLIHLHEHQAALGLDEPAVMASCHGTGSKRPQFPPE